MAVGQFFVPGRKSRFQAGTSVSGATSFGNCWLKWRLKGVVRLSGKLLEFWSTPSPRIRLGFPILKISHIPGGDWHPGWGVDLSYSLVVN